MKNFTLAGGLAVAVGSLLCAISGNAQVTATIGGAADSGANYVNFDSLSAGQDASFTSGAMTVNFAGTAQTQIGSAAGASVPFLSGANGTFFGPGGTTQANGLDSTTYLQANTSAGSGSLTFDFSSPQLYIGMLIGSVDANNNLEFFSGPNGTGADLGGISGNTLQVLAPTLSFGDTGDANGTVYLNVNSAVPFESVVATTGTTTLEIDDIAYGVASTVPDGCTTLGLLSGALIGLQAIRRKLVR